MQAIRVILIVVLAMLPVWAGANTELPRDIDALLDKYGIPRDAVSIDVREIESQKILLSLHRHTARNPASVIKLLTTLSALELLGPAYQWETTYLIDGRIKQGVLEGNLVLKGGGDPYLTIDRFWRHIQAIRQRGIQQITGDLIIDHSYFDIPLHDRGLFDGKATRLYNVGPGAALVNFSATHFVIQPIDAEIIVLADPPLDDLVIENNLQPRKGKCAHKPRGWRVDTVRRDETVAVRFNGHYRPQCGQYTFGRSLFGNNEYTFRLFKVLWRDSGGIFKGSYQVRATPTGATAVVTAPSEPLGDVITGINKFSNNVMARQLLLTVGAQAYGAPGTLEAGITGIRSWLNRIGVSMSSLVFENGAGLSRNARWSASDISSLLAHGWTSNYRPEFLSSLPLAALDGTMKQRLKNNPIQGRARIKTGFINNVRSMAGYVHARNGQYYSVVMMIDSKRVNYHNGNRIQDVILSWAYDREGK